MSNPYSMSHEHRLKYWMKLYNSQFERANELELNLIHAEYEMLELKARVADLLFENESLKASDRIENVVGEVLGKLEVSNDKY